VEKMKKGLQEIGSIRTIKQINIDRNNKDKK